MAASTVSRVFGCTSSGSLMTRDTVIRETPASRDTSRIVGRLARFIRVTECSWAMGSNPPLVQVDRVERRGRADEQPTVDASFKGQVSEHLGDEKFPEQPAIGSDAVDTIGGACPDIAVLVDPEASAVPGSM